MRNVLIRDMHIMYFKVPIISTKPPIMPKAMPAYCACLLESEKYYYKVGMWPIVAHCLKQSLTSGILIQTHVTSDTSPPSPFFNAQH